MTGLGTIINTAVVVDGGLWDWRGVFRLSGVFVSGAITLAAAFLGSFVSDLSFIGSVLIFCVGVNIGFGKKFRVGNMLPALITPIVYEMLLAF